MLGLPGIAMVGFGLAALVARHWRYKIHRAARRNAIATNHVHLALDPTRWGELGEEVHAKKASHSAIRRTAQENRYWERMIGNLPEPEEESETGFITINCESQDSRIRAAQRRQAFKVISNV
jgi:hypothetical protein